MGTAPTPAEPAPTFARAGVTRDFQQLRVVDATTGEALSDVVEADVDAGRVVRRVLDETGHLVIENDAIKLSVEQRTIRIEWAPAEPAPADPTDPSAGTVADAVPPAGEA